MTQHQTPIPLTALVVRACRRWAYFVTTLAVAAVALVLHMRWARQAAREREAAILAPLEKLQSSLAASQSHAAAPVTYDHSPLPTPPLRVVSPSHPQPTPPSHPPSQPTSHPPSPQQRSPQQPSPPPQQQPLPRLHQLSPADATPLELPPPMPLTPAADEAATGGTTAKGEGGGGRSSQLGVALSALAYTLSSALAGGAQMIVHSKVFSELGAMLLGGDAAPFSSWLLYVELVLVVACGILWAYRLTECLVSRRATAVCACA